MQGVNLGPMVLVPLYSQLGYDWRCELVRAAPIPVTATQQNTVQSRGLRRVAPCLMRVPLFEALIYAASP